MSDASAVLWSPRPAAGRTPLVAQYARTLRESRGVGVSGYDELWRWSVADLEGFWGSLWDFFGVSAHDADLARAGRSRDAGRRVVPGRAPELRRARAGRGWRRRAASRSSRTPRRARRVELTFGELREQVARARAGLQRLGVGPGDRVAAYLPNIPETLVAFLATASLGAVWASCAPELGPRSVIDRLGPARAEGAAGDRRLPLRRRRPSTARAEVAQIRAALPTLEHVVHVPYAGGADDALARRCPGTSSCAESGPLAFEPVPFDHPLYVLFSSGTTGLPKAIVHRHGGILVEHLKNHGAELGPAARRPAAVVHDDLVDDVERARLGAAGAARRS